MKKLLNASDRNNVQALSRAYNLPAEEVRRNLMQILLVEQSQEKCKNCDGQGLGEKCNGMVEVIEPIAGRFSRAVRMCKWERIKREQARAKKLFTTAEIPSQYKQDDFASYEITPGNSNAVNEAHNFLAGRKTGLFLHGNTGTGKTKLAAVIANAKIRQGVTTLFATVPDLLDEIRHSISSNEESEKMNLARGIDFLVLDDLGVERLTPWVGEKLFALINYRCSEELPTVITSNFSIPELAKRMAFIGKDGYVDDMPAKRIVSRICGLCEPVQLTGRDRRKE